MIVSDNGINLIRSKEGLRLRSYQDAAGVWTIGYGHTKTAEPGKSITNVQAEVLLRKDVHDVVIAIREHLANHTTQGQFDAFVSLAFNIGVGGFLRSTALKRHNAGNYGGAAQAIKWWNKVKVGDEHVVNEGLVKRRTAEAELYLRSVDIGIKIDKSLMNSEASCSENWPAR